MSLRRTSYSILRPGRGVSRQQQHAAAFGAETLFGSRKVEPPFPVEVRQRGASPPDRQKSVGLRETCITGVLLCLISPISPKVTSLENPGRW